MNKKQQASHRVYVQKHDPGTYTVIEHTLDKDGVTVNWRLHGSGYSYKEAHALKREILDCYK